MYYKLKHILFSLLVFNFGLSAQPIHSSANNRSPLSTSSNYHVSYHEKTAELRAGFDPRLSFTGINVFPVNSFFSSSLIDVSKMPGYEFVIKSDDVIKAFDHNLYHPELTQFMNWKYFGYLTKKIRKLMKVGRPIITSDDSLTIVNELKQLRKLLKDSLVSNYKMSDELYSTLKKYPADNQLLTDVSYFKTKRNFTEQADHWALVRLYVFDLRNRQLIYYKYQLELRGLKQGEFTLNDVPAEGIGDLIKDYRHYVRENNKYLKGRSK